MPDRVHEELLTGDELRRWEQAPLGYAEVGATTGVLPPGYHHLPERVRLGTGTATFESAAAELVRWEVQRRAGLRVTPSAPAVDVGVVAVLRIGLGPAALRAPVRVVHVVDEPDRRGYAYGTLVGHPERGEEAFVVERDDAGRVWFTVTAFSVPARWPMRMAGPVGRLFQRAYAWRLGRALRTLTR